MTRTLLFAAAAAAMLAGAALSQTVETLRGAGVTDAVTTEDVFRRDETRVTRNHRLRPPLIPHSIDPYPVDLNYQPLPDLPRLDDRRRPRCAGAVDDP